MQTVDVTSAPHVSRSLRATVKEGQKHALGTLLKEAVDATQGHKGRLVLRGLPRKAASVILFLLLTAGALVAVSSPSHAATTWNVGDVFAGVGKGSYNVYDNAGNFKETISDGLGGFTTGCAFNPALDRLYTTDFSNTKVVAYDNAPPHGIAQVIDTAATSPGGHSESVVFAANGDFFVGHPDGNDLIHRYNAGGTLLETYSAAVDARGTDWMDLAADQTTLFYTSEGRAIQRFDVGSNAQLANFAVLPGSGNAFALRLLPPGDGTGGLLVADRSNVKRLDGSGAVVQTYDVAREDNWFSLNLDPNGSSFWAGDFGTNNFYRFNIATGAVEVGPIASGGSLFGLCVKGELTAALPEITLTPAAAENEVGSSHTVTATIESGGDPVAGVLVTFTVSGANAGVAGTCNPSDCTTDVNGQVTFTYTGMAAGDDTIKACFTEQGGQQSCATATKTWTAPLITIDDVIVIEGDAGTTPAVFTVSLSSATSVPVQLDYATADGTATAGSDYVATAGTLIVAPGDTSETITVDVIGDVTDEADETFVVNLSNASNAQIDDAQGLGTIIDDDRDGVFTCRASALRLASTETIVANPGNNPCVDDSDALAGEDEAAGGLDVRAKVLHVMTDQTPDDLESTDPAVGDNAVAEAGVAEVRISSGPHTIEARTVVSRAKVECVPSDTGGLAPRLSSSSTITSLTINGVAVNVNGSATISVGGLTLHINEQVMTADSVTQRALRLSGPDIPTLVVAEAVADFSGNPCMQ